MPGPGSETAFQKFCGAEYERVFEIALGMIRESTRLAADQAGELARRIAAAHADALYAHLTDEKPAGARTPEVVRKERGMRGKTQARSLEMHRGTAGATMGV